MQVDDLVALRWWTVGALVLVNAPLGPLPIAAFAFAYLLVWLSFKWFFWPAIKKSLLLAFATHNPITLAIELHAVAVTASQIGPVDRHLAWCRSCSASSSPSRRGRPRARSGRPPRRPRTRPTERALGWKVAPFLPAFFIASCALLVLVGHRADVSPIFLCNLPPSRSPRSASAPRYSLRLAPTPARANLRPWAEAYTVVANVGLVIALIVRYGATLS